MRTVRLPLLRGALFLIALAAIAFILARGDNPAAATSYNPVSTVSVSDPTPGANADITVNFSLEAPDAFPNVRTNSSIQFLPRQWGVHVPETEEEKLARIGSVAGTFDALATIGMFGNWPCVFPVVVPFTMFDANVDTSNLTSPLDFGAGRGQGGSDLHPMGVGYSGQFADDPDTMQPPGDVTDPPLPLIAFNPDEGYSPDVWTGEFAPLDSYVYRDVDGNHKVTPGDIRLLVGYARTLDNLFPGTVLEGDLDVAIGFSIVPFSSDYKHSETVSANGQMDIGETVYQDVDGSGDVSYNDIRVSVFAQVPPPSTVQDFAFYGGVTRYPDFLNQMFPPDVVGEPLARQWGGRQVIYTPVSLNILTFRPGQLPGYPASLGYPNVVILLNPVSPIDMIQIGVTSDLCTPLSLTSTNLGVSKDNPATLGNEGGYVRLTNPKAEKSHDFTLVSISQPDADDDGIENMLDTCPFDPNIGDLDGRGGRPLDSACDPDPLSSTPHPLEDDEDRDNYKERADNCPTVANGAETLGEPLWVESSGFLFPVAITGDLIGPSNQTDTDGDDIGDACEGAEHGTQCLNDLDDDGDGVVNDGCPINSYHYGETGDQCLNDVDDDLDGYVNDGCPYRPNAETGDQCLNNLDDDGDGMVNDGCPAVGSRAEFARATTIRVFLQPGTIIASSQFYFYSKEKAFDGLTNTSWCASNTDKAPGNYIEAQFNSPQDIETLDLTSQWAWQSFLTGTITMSNGFSQDITLTNGGGSFTFPTQTGVTWVRFTGLTQNASLACFSEFNLNFTGVTTLPAECGNGIDDDGDGVVDDGCPAFPGSWPYRESGAQCLNAVDDDFDGAVNDGCPVVGAWGVSEAQCDNNINDDPLDDSYINDGCPAVGEPETGDQCGNLADDDGDGYVNDGCPVVGSIAETDGCDNNLDDDGDGLVNDGCPAVDPGDVAKTTITGHMHVVTLTQGVTIARHGVKLDDLDGKEKVAASGSARYTVSVENKASDVSQDAPTALRVVEGCARVNGAEGTNSTTLSIPGDASRTATFDVDWSGCPDGEYTIQADACHAGDPAPAGFFGADGCPGTDPHVQQPASGPLSLSGATASSEAFGPDYSAAKAIDGITDTLWCTAFEPGVNIQASFASPTSVEQVNIDNSYFDYGYAFTTGTLSFSNGFSQDVTLSTAAETISVPLQSGVEWVRFTATEGGWAGCISELKANGFVPVYGDTNLLDDAPRSITVVVGTP